MKLRLLAVIAGLLFTTGAASAQIGVYGTPTFSRITNSTPDNSVFSFLGPNNKSGFFKGVGFGVYDDFYHSTSGKLAAGIDVRGTILRGGGAQLNSFMLGARVEYKPDNTKLKPFAELIGGVGSTKAPHNPQYVSKATYQVSGGVDYPLSKRVDWRAIEVGYGSLTTVSAGIFNGATQIQPASKLLNFSTGLVFRFK